MQKSAKWHQHAKVAAASILKWRAPPPSLNPPGAAPAWTCTLIPDAGDGEAEDDVAPADGGDARECIDDGPYPFVC